MSIIVEAPKEYYGLLRNRWPSLFIAGGITGCEDWQKALIQSLQREEIIIYNPRRENFPIGDSSASEVQICWEFDKLLKADIVSFWFAFGTDNPIVLYELGMWGNSQPGRPIVVGVDEKYTRKTDVLFQTSLARPEIRVARTFAEFTWEVQNIVRMVAGKPAMVPTIGNVKK